MFTFKGFCGHQLHDVLIAPGTADLTADVDFSYLRRMAQGKVASLGPVEQRTFLKNMGIDVRLKVMVYLMNTKYLHLKSYLKEALLTQCCWSEQVLVWSCQK